MSDGAERRAARLLRQMRLEHYALVAIILLLTGLALFTASPRSRADRAFHVVVGLVPPYIDERGEGTEAATIRRLLAEQLEEDNVAFHILPFSRHWGAFLDDDRYDAVATVPAGLDLRGARSEPYVVYQNGVGFRCSLFPDGLRTFDPTDLYGLKVVAFGGAASILPGLAEARPQMSAYAEIRDQKAHSELLLSGRVDIVIADGSILAHYNRIVAEENGAPEGWLQPDELCFCPVFPPTEYALVFRDDDARTKFNRGLGAARLAGGAPQTFACGRN